MSYILKPSLENITVAKISSVLWNQSDTRESIENFNGILSYTSSENEEWKKIYEKVIEKVHRLPLPDLLKEKISSFVKPMGWQILKWMQYLDGCILIKKGYPRFHKPVKLLWTQYGTIDRKETAKLLIEDKTIDRYIRYQLAYIYCLEGDLQKQMWDSFPEDCQDCTIEREGIPVVINEQDLRCFYANNDNYALTDDAFRHAVRLNNKEAAEYFLQRLTPKEKEDCLLEAVHFLPEAEVLCFLLSQMSEEQRIAAFQINSVAFMLRIFDWPYMSFFVETANRVWDSLSTFSPFNRSFPLRAWINSKVKYNFDNGMFREIFTVLWKCTYKRFGFDVDYICVLLTESFPVTDKNNIELIFRNMSSAHKEEIILSNFGLQISRQLVERNEFELLEFFIQQCLPTVHESKQYKKKLNRLRPYHFRACKNE